MTVVLVSFVSTYVLECEKESKNLKKNQEKNSCPDRLVSTEIKSEHSVSNFQKPVL